MLKKRNGSGDGVSMSEEKHKNVEDKKVDYEKVCSYVAIRMYVLW